MRLLVSLLVALAGCATQVPRPEDPKIACFKPIPTMSALQPLNGRIKLDGSAATLEMTAIADKPNATERAALSAYSNARNDCIAAGRAWSAQYRPPGFRAVEGHGFAQLDALLGALYRQEITFGQFNQQRDQLRAESVRQFNLVEELYRRERDEARRQVEVARILAPAPAPFQVPMPPPVTPRTTDTTCRMLGSQMNCESVQR